MVGSPTLLILVAFFVTSVTRLVLQSKNQPFTGLIVMSQRFPHHQQTPRLPGGQNQEDKDNNEKPKHAGS